MVCVLVALLKSFVLWEFKTSDFFSLWAGYLERFWQGAKKSIFESSVKMWTWIGWILCFFRALIFYFLFIWGMLEDENKENGGGWPHIAPSYQIFKLIGKIKWKPFMTSDEGNSLIFSFLSFWQNLRWVLEKWWKKTTFQIW